MRWPRVVQAWWRHAFGPKTLGQRGEAAAAQYLKRLGYKIVGRGTHIGRGELDIIAIDGRRVVFVEVKTRDSSVAGEPHEAVDRNKQERLTRLALVYLKRYGLLDYPARFDVVSIIWPSQARRPTIEHIKNAFEATGRGQMFS
ncbi:MAG TPA: YraN family protein [Pirellulales bacterium]|jgi:putative endonuclease|nr:YraN family protein [Pirellulales bacterium]